MFSLANSAGATCIARKQSLNSVILFILIQMTHQISTSTSTSATRTSQQFNYLLPRRMSTPTPLGGAMQEEPLVFDTNSLYKTTKSPTSRHKRSTLVNTDGKFIVDACQSKMEVLTPYHATNSKGKVRTIINSELMQQAIQVETCLRSTSTASAPNRCSAQADCGCEQKYKWHRLLVLDPSGEAGPAKGLFMDWFLFPSNCVCRCRSGPTSTRHFMRTIIQAHNKQ